MIFGGGDAEPMVAIADALGWETVLIDPRVNSAKPERFPAATIIGKDAMENLGGKPWFSLASAAVIMTHNINLDAAALWQRSGNSLSRILAGSGQ